MEVLRTLVLRALLALVLSVVNFILLTYLDSDTFKWCGHSVGRTWNAVSVLGHLLSFSALWCYAFIAFKLFIIRAEPTAAVSLSYQISTTISSGNTGCPFGVRLHSRWATDAISLIIVYLV